MSNFFLRDFEINEHRRLDRHIEEIDAMVIDVKRLWQAQNVHHPVGQSLGGEPGTVGCVLCDQGSSTNENWVLSSFTLGGTYTDANGCTMTLQDSIDGITNVCVPCSTAASNRIAQGTGDATCNTGMSFSVTRINTNTNEWTLKVTLNDPLLAPSGIVDSAVYTADMSEVCNFTDNIDFTLQYTPVFGTGWPATLNLRKEDPDGAFCTPPPPQLCTGTEYFKLSGWTTGEVSGTTSLFGGGCPCGNFWDKLIADDLCAVCVGDNHARSDTTPSTCGTTLRDAFWEVLRDGTGSVRVRIWGSMNGFFGVPFPVMLAEYTSTTYPDNVGDSVTVTYQAPFFGASCTGFPATLTLENVAVGSCGTVSEPCALCTTDTATYGISISGTAGDAFCSVADTVITSLALSCSGVGSPATGSTTNSGYTYSASISGGNVAINIFNFGLGDFRSATYSLDGDEPPCDPGDNVNATLISSNGCTFPATITVGRST